MRVLLLALMLALLLPLDGAAQQVGVRFDIEASSVQAEGRERRNRPRPLELVLAADSAVPYRVYFVRDPLRLVVDFRGLDFAQDQPEALAGAQHFQGIRWGVFRPGWSRMVAELPAPYLLTEAIQETAPDGSARIRLRMKPVAEKDFVVRQDTLTALWDLPESSVPRYESRPPPGQDRPLRVVIDPGHGGIDPGAQVGAITEAALMLIFSRELRAALEARGIEVVATRDGDTFVPLERRITIARAADADMFISLHADALPVGQAAGAAVFIWDRAANDRAAAELATRHDRDDLISRTDLTGTEDEIVQTLIALALVDTQPRSRNLAGMLSSEMTRGGIVMHRQPIRGAAFSVLKSPDIPSVLIELGFLTDEGDRANLLDPAWRARMAGAITRAVEAWATDEAQRAPLLRK